MIGEVTGASSEHAETMMIIEKSAKSAIRVFMCFSIFDERDYYTLVNM
jgi:hypothetical protein